MKFNKDLIINIFYIAVSLIICGLAIIFIPNVTSVENFYSLYSDFNIFEIVFGKNESEDEYFRFDSKKFYLRTKNAIDGVRNKINEDEKFLGINFDEDTLYMIPVGKDRCYDDKYSEENGLLEYLYVGVTTNDTGYSYYVMAYDFSENGIKFMSESDFLSKNIEDVVVEIKKPLDMKSVYSETASDLSLSILDNSFYGEVVEELHNIAKSVNKNTIVVLRSCNIESDENSGVVEINVNSNKK